MPRRRRERAEIWLGLLVLVSVALLTWGYFWLTGQPLGEPGYPLVVELANAEGLSRGDRVRISGVEVGSVRGVELAPDGRVFVDLHVSPSVRLPRDSRAILQSSGFFGDRYIELRPGSASELVSRGDTLTAASAPSIMEAAQDLSDQAGAVLGQVQRLLADTTISQVQGGVAAAASSLKELQRLVAARSDDFARMSQSLARTAQALEQSVVGRDLGKTIDEMQGAAAQLAEASESLKSSAQSLASISRKIDQGQGTLGLLVNDPSLYEELRSTTRSIGALTRDLRENPSRYLKFSVF